MNDSTNVSFGKPKASGAVFIAPAGTTVPTDATSALAGAFKGLGYVREDGMVNSVSVDTNTINAWGGDAVLVSPTKFSETFTINLIETAAEALKLYYGEDNVDVSGDNITVRQNSAPLPEVVVVFELVLTGGRVKRIVLPKGQIADRSGDITYKDGEAIAYPVVFNALPDSEGNTHTEYIAVVGS